MTSRAGIALGLAALLAPAIAHATPIIGGQTTTTTAYPSVVDLETDPGDWFCTGTLISDTWVLTAAHCLAGQSAGTVNVRFGDTDITQGTGGTVVPAAEIDANPAYSDDPWEHDVALVMLATPMTGRAPTPIDRTALPIGTTVTKVGYGDSDDQGDGAGVLRALAAPTIDCAQAGDPGISSANLLCFDASTAGSCYGDSGGPAFVGGGTLSVAGITSGGTGSDCTGPGVYDIYTAVAAELDFIDAVTGTGSGSATAPMGGSTPSGPGNGGPAIPEGDGGGCAAGGGDGASVVLVGVFLIGISRKRRSPDHGARALHFA